MIDFVILLAFLAHLWRGGLYSYYWKNGYASWFPVDKAPRVASDACDLYMGLYPLAKPRAPWQRATNDTVMVLNCVYADFDGKDFVEVSPAEVTPLLAAIRQAKPDLSTDETRRKATAEAKWRKFRADSAPYMALAYQHIQSLPCPPSVVVCSGGGYQPYWLFDQPFQITSDDERDRAKRLVAAWVAYIGADPAAKDLARILRRPGTWNTKYVPPRPVTFMSADLDRVYSVAQLEAMLPRTEPHGISRRLANARNGGSEAVYFQGAINQLARAYEGSRNDSLNKTAFLAGQLVAGGSLDEAEAERQLRAVAVEIGLDEKEAARTIRSGLNAGLRNPRPVQATRYFETRPDGLRVRPVAGAHCSLRTVTIKRSNHGTTHCA